MTEKKITKIIKKIIKNNCLLDNHFLNNYFFTNFLAVLLALSLAFFVLISAGCAKLPETGEHPIIKEYPPVDVNQKLDFGEAETFEDVFNAVKLVDRKYQVDFKREVLFGAMIDKRVIPNMKQDLKKLRAILDPENKMNAEKIIKEVYAGDRSEKQLGLILVDARIKMVESQQKFHEAYANGAQGLVGDGFFCREEETIIESIDSFNQSAKRAATATYYLDELLTDSKQITWNLVGVEDNKPLFYFTPVDLMWAQLKTNRQILNEYCSETRLGSKPKEKAHISFDQATHRDLFVHPNRVIPIMVWNKIKESADIKEVAE